MNQTEHYKRDNCRLCGSEKLIRVLEIEPTPPANEFVPKSKLSIEQKKFPLDIFFCETCSHLQLLDVVNPTRLFEDYVYVSGTSPVFVKHFEDYANSIIDRYDIEKESFIIDIGSNDGTLLRFFKDAGMRVLGIDPAKDIARRATESGIETLPEFFNMELAETILDKYGKIDVITANNVFAHADDLQGIVEAVKFLLHRDGLFIFEVSYLVDVYTKTLFDTMYHEHLSYHSVKPLIPFFKQNNMELIEAIRIPSHGGSIRCIVKQKDGKWTSQKSVEDMVQLEESLGIDKSDTLKQFGNKIDSVKMELKKIIKNIKDDSKRIAAYGAPAKATTLMYHFDIGPDTVEYIVDDSPLKQGLYSPGYHIPVLSSKILDDDPVDYLILLAWNFADPIIKNNKKYLNSGGTFIVPLPEIKVVKNG